MASTTEADERQAALEAVERWRRKLLTAAAEFLQEEFQHGHMQSGGYTVALGTAEILGTWLVNLKRHDPERGAAWCAHTLDHLVAHVETATLPRH